MGEWNYVDAGAFGQRSVTALISSHGIVCAGWTTESTLHLVMNLLSTADDLPGSVIPGKDVKHRREETCCNCNLAEAQR